MSKNSLAMLVFILSLLSHPAMAAGEDGEILFRRYCGRCHGDSEKRSGSLVFHSKNTIISRYRNRPRQLLHKLENIEKESISNIMVTAIHNIEDKKILRSIVIHLAVPETAKESKEQAL